jgi:integrase
MGLTEVPTAAQDRSLDDRLAALEEVSEHLATTTLAANTRRAYDKAWHSFDDFCREHELASLPAHPETVRWYVAWMSGQNRPGALDDLEQSPRFAISTIRQHLAGIAEHHLREGHLDPTGHRAVTDLVRGLDRSRRQRSVGKTPLLLGDVKRLLEHLDERDLPGIIPAARDALAIHLGFTGALRRSEAAALATEQAHLHVEDGVHIHVGASKADQTNSLPDVIVLPYGSAPLTCGPCALHRWMGLVIAGETGTQSGIVELIDERLDQGVHLCGHDGLAPLISSRSLRSRAPLLRAVTRNRSAAGISERGVSGDALHTMLMNRLRQLGIDPGPYGFHSLRAGHVTQARRNGASTEEIMRAGRWRKAETVNVYDREHSPLVRNSVLHLGL